LFRVPEQIFHTAVTSAVVTFSEINQQASLKLIHFVDLNPEMVKTVYRAFETCCKSSLKSETTVASGSQQRRISSSMSDQVSPITTPTYMDSPRKSNSSIHTSPTSPTGMPSKFKLMVFPDIEDLVSFDISEFLTVMIYTGDITESLCHTIVCSEDEDLKGEGNIAKAISEKAGARYKRDKDKKRKEKKHQIGDIIFTGAGSLPKINNVLHIVMPVETCEVMKSKELKKGYMDNLRACTNQLFTAVISWNLQSVALPMFGLGNFTDFILYI